MSSGTTCIVVGCVVLIAIVLSSMWNKDDLKRLQELKNKRRFSGKRLPPDELAELEQLSKKYWWY